MKSFFLLAAMYLVCAQAKAADTDLINPIIGNQSFETVYGFNPDIISNDQLRIQTHLAYVENILRNKNTDHLSDQEKINRDAALDLLHQYWTAGIFPKNYDHPEKRVPCFIDKDATICAVGYLIEKTAGRDVAEKINAKHKYETIMEMQDALVTEWIENSGLSLDECAMIQPTYDDYYFNSEDVNTGYAISTAVLTGGNISISVINAIQIANQKGSNTLPCVGILTGVGQIMIGALNYEGQTSGLSATESISLVNITSGISTIFLSTWNLADNHKKNNSTSYGFFPTPIDKNKYGLSFGFGMQF